MNLKKLFYTKILKFNYFFLGRNKEGGREGGGGKERERETPLGIDSLFSVLPIFLFSPVLIHLVMFQHQSPTQKT